MPIFARIGGVTRLNGPAPSSGVGLHVALTAEPAALARSAMPLSVTLSESAPLTPDSLRLRERLFEECATMRTASSGHSMRSA